MFGSRTPAINQVCSLVLLLSFHGNNMTLLRRMFPVGTICGNTYIMKPSERDPTACMVLVDLLKEAGMPDGVVNVIHGSHDTVNFICDHPDIRAISFVGETPLQCFNASLRFDSSLFLQYGLPQASTGWA